MSNNVFPNIVPFMRKCLKIWYSWTGHKWHLIRRMRFACWIIKATNTLRIWNTHRSFTVPIATRKRLNVTSYVYCRSCILTLTSGSQVVNACASCSKIYKISVLPILNGVKWWDISVGVQNESVFFFYYCAVHFDNIKVLFTNECTLY
jgi:hypothetical protein